MTRSQTASGNEQASGNEIISFRIPFPVDFLSARPLLEQQSENLSARMSLSVEVQQINRDTWRLFQDSHGRILDEYTVRKWTFYKGIAPESRSLVWKFLLSYYPFCSTMEERCRIDEENRCRYVELVDTWNSPAFVPDLQFSEYKRVIEKDSWRTDRHLEFYSDGSGNIEALQKILKSFVIYNPEMGYIQGMNDILSLLLLVMQCDHEAFWCFTEVMRRMHSILSDLTLAQPLNGLARLCWYVDKQLYDHIGGVYDGEDWLFCYRWILLQFKREFVIDEIYTLWECIWSHHATGHFLMFFAMSVLLHFKQQLLQCSTVEAFMETWSTICPVFVLITYLASYQWTSLSMDLHGRIPLDPVLSSARTLTEQLKADEYCPHELRYLVSSNGCAPPPLIGFVRARQSFSTLHSSKVKLQRDQIWKSLFGDTPVQPITSPFMLSPVNNNQSNGSEVTSSTSNHVKGTSSHVQNDTNAMEFMAPPKVGFIPREEGIKLREDIRKAKHTVHDSVNGGNRQKQGTVCATTDYTCIQNHLLVRYQNGNGTVDFKHTQLHGGNNINGDIPVSMVPCEVTGTNQHTMNAGHHYEVTFDDLRGEAELPL